MTTTPASAAPTLVRHFRQILLWPLQLVTEGAGGQHGHARPWDQLGDDGPWQPVNGHEAFAERHYNEFVAFLPYVQRFLYGDAGAPGGSESPMRVFRRHDITQARVVPHAGSAPVTLKVEHVDLTFFYDVELVLLSMELSADELPLAVAQELLYRCGRAYPSAWDAQGHSVHCLYSAEWLNAQGDVLARSDAQSRELFVQHVAQHHSPRIASHWAWLLKPLVSDNSAAHGPLRYRLIEYYRMPVMAYLALDEPQKLSRSDLIRLGLVTAAAPDAQGAVLPFAEAHLDNFETRFCYDRFWCPEGQAPYTRYLCNGHSLVVVGTAQAAFFACGERGVLAQFRHQHFKLFLIAHFQKAALMMYSDRLVQALRAMDVTNAASVRRFKRSIRRSFEAFLRFTHRYWFHEISEQAQVRALFQLCASHLGLDPLYAEVKERIADMSTYLDADSIRRQANTVVRLTVVTIMGLVGTLTTGFLGMNLLSEADAPMSERVAVFTVVTLACIALVVYTMVKSKRLSDFLDALSDERLSWWAKCRAFLGIWVKGAE